MIAFGMSLQIFVTTLFVCWLIIWLHVTLILRQMTWSEMLFANFYRHLFKVFPGSSEKNAKVV